MVRRLLTAVAGVATLICGLGLCLTPSSAQSLAYNLNPPQDFFEARFGAFAHGVGSLEQGSVDINAELVFPQLWDLHNRYNWLHLDDSWSWLIPRPHVGGMFNTDGRTSYVYGGALWTYNVTRKIFLEGFLGGAVHNGVLAGDATHNSLGCRVLFHVGGSAGYRIMPRWSVLFTFDHISNGNAVLNACSSNVGLNEYGVRLGYAF